eukprot:7153611-Pyramimonas_sp.AAC.1
MSRSPSRYFSRAWKTNERGAEARAPVSKGNAVQHRHCFKLFKRMRTALRRECYFSPTGNSHSTPSL